MSRRALALVCGLVLALPTAASADTRLTLEAGNAVLFSEDPSVANELTIEVRGNDIRFYEPKDPKGFTYPFAECREGETRGQVPIEVFCPRASIRGVTVEIGPAEDQVANKIADLPMSATGGTGVDGLAGAEAADALYGEQGNDVLIGAGGDDDLRGDDGNDRIEGGTGNDTVTGGPGTDTMAPGPGDDMIDSADGLKETIHCGEGNDKGVADTLDELVGCEEVVRREVAAPTDEVQGDDTTKPRLTVGALSTQRVTRRRRWVQLIATSSERGLVQAAGYLATGGIDDAFRSTQAKVTLAGGAVRLRFRLSSAQFRRVQRDLRRRRRARVRIIVSAVDAAGNTSAARRVWIRLRR